MEARSAFPSEQQMGPHYPELSQQRKAGCPVRSEMSMTKIFRELVTHYVGTHVTSEVTEYPDSFDELPVVLDRDIEQAGESARQAGHLEELKLGIQLMLTHSDKELHRDLAYEFDWPEGELHKILRHIHTRLWPGEPIPEGGPKNAQWAELPDGHWIYSVPGNLDDYEKAKREGKLDEVLTRFAKMDEIQYDDFDD